MYNDLIDAYTQRGLSGILQWNLHYVTGIGGSYTCVVHSPGVFPVFLVPWCYTLIRDSLHVLPWLVLYLIYGSFQNTWCFTRKIGFVHAGVYLYSGLFTWCYALNCPPACWYSFCPEDPLEYLVWYPFKQFPFPGIIPSSVASWCDTPFSSSISLVLYPCLWLLACWYAPIIRLLHLVLCPLFCLPFTWCYTLNSGFLHAGIPF